MRWLPPVALVVIFGCTGGSSSTGGSGEHLATLTITAKGIYGACQLAGLPSNEFTYQGTFRRGADAGTATFYDGIGTFDAGFDGQTASFGAKITQQFSLLDGGNCNACEMNFWQGADLALLSPSQNAAVGDMCPANPFDGGVPYNEDAGIFRSQPADGGYDVVRACGEFNVVIVGEGINCDPACYSCKLQYRLNAVRAN